MENDVQKSTKVRFIGTNVETKSPIWIDLNRKWRFQQENLVFELFIVVCRWNSHEHMHSWTLRTSFWVNFVQFCSFLSISLKFVVILNQLVLLSFESKFGIEKNSIKIYEKPPDFNNPILLSINKSNSLRFFHHIFVDLLKWFNLWFGIGIL